MEQGLAQSMVYGNGSNQNTTHYYQKDKKVAIKKQKSKKKIK